MGFVFSKVFNNLFTPEDKENTNVNFRWDLGGQTSIRPYWRSYYPQTDAVIYVIDSSDKQRLDLSKQELLSILNEEELKNTPLMILANKQDIKGALDESEITTQMGLSDIQTRQWAIFKCCAMTGQGINEGMEWLVNILNQEYQKK